MENTIFREKNVESISSPDSLNDYIRVVRPSLWITLFAIILLLAGVTVWGVVGHLDTVVNAVVISEDGDVTAYIKDSDSRLVLERATITINGTDYEYNADETFTTKLSVDSDYEILSYLGAQEDLRARCFIVDADILDGIYEGTILVDSVRPMQFITD